MIRTRSQARGFSLLELMIVVGVSLAVAAIAIPSAITATQNYKLRSTASSVSGVIQKARMLSVARNSYYPVASTSGGLLSVDVGTSSVNPADKVSLQLSNGITIVTSGAPAVNAIAGSLTPFTTSLPQFNPRGLPCFGSPCVADPSKMYIMFLRQDRSLTNTGWAAVNVTPAGRVQVWTWSGTSWQ